jgi:hypothetical protein
MEPNERRVLIERYRTGPDAVLAAVRGLTDEQLDARPDPVEWTVREIVHHLGDSELRAALRLRQLLAEDDPVVQGYDEPEYAQRLHYDRPVATSLDLMRAARASTAELLVRMDDQDWSRSGTHTESGPYSAEDWLRIYASHAFDHADQIRRTLGE